MVERDWKEKGVYDTAKAKMFPCLSSFLRVIQIILAQKDQKVKLLKRIFSPVILKMNLRLNDISIFV